MSRGFAKVFSVFLKKFSLAETQAVLPSFFENAPRHGGGGLGDSIVLIVTDQDAEVSSSTGASKMATPSKKPAPIIWTRASAVGCS